MKNSIIEILQNIVKELTLKDLNIELNKPKDINFGDFSTNIALHLSKIVGKNPMEIGEEIVSKFKKEVQAQQENRDLQLIEKVELVSPGFINIYLTSKAMIDTVKRVIDRPKDKPITQNMLGKRVIIEFTDPNPFKEFHIGHVYTNTVGESLSRLYEANGAIVQRADYYGDVGMHIAKALWGVLKKFEEDKIGIADLNLRGLNDRIHYLGQAYAMGSKAYEDDKDAQEKIRDLNKLVYVAAQRMWQKEKGMKPQVEYMKPEEINEEELAIVYGIYTQGRKWSLEYFNEIYKRLGMQFSGDYPESIAGEKGYLLVKSHITDGVFKKSNGAVIFDAEEFGLHTRVFINSLGLPTYESKELGLAVWKHEEFSYDFSIILTGNEINEYFKVLMKALSLIEPELASKSMHVGHGMVKLSSGKKMSSRSGQIISGKEVLDKAKQLAREKISLSKMDKKDEQGDAEKVAEQVGIGAIKYAFLKSGIGHDISFSFEESVSFDGNAGPYIQYTYVRTKSILEKAGEPNHELSDSAYTPNKDEIQILRHMENFEEIVTESAAQIAPNLLANYLYELAKSYNLFYQKYRIVDAKSIVEKNFRLALTHVTGEIIQKGLYLLGIDAPERM